MRTLARVPFFLDCVTFTVSPLSTGSKTTKLSYQQHTEDLRESNKESVCEMKLTLYSTSCFTFMSASLDSHHVYVMTFLKELFPVTLALWSSHLVNKEKHLTYEELNTGRTGELDAQVSLLILIIKQMTNLLSFVQTVRG